MKTNRSSQATRVEPETPTYGGHVPTPNIKPPVLFGISLSLGILTIILVAASAYYGTIYF